MTEREQFEKWWDGAFTSGDPEEKYTAWCGWKARAASPKGAQGVEEWIAENGLQFVDTMGGFAVNLNRSKTCQYPYPEYVSVDDLRAYLSGMAIVPVEEAQSGYAGATIWVGDKSVTRIVSKAVMISEVDCFNAITLAAQECLDLLAAAKDQS